MPVTIEAFYDFRSPYAYFAHCRLRDDPPAAIRDVEWLWRPVSIDVLLNLQAGREPWAPYVDPLSAPKRAHLMADVRRMSQFYGAPLRPPNPPRPNTIPALCIAEWLQGQVQTGFQDAVFTALWREQRDVGDIQVLTDCLLRSGGDEALAAQAFATTARAELAERTTRAYARGVFGVPSFVHDGDVFFGADRLDLLAWKLDRLVVGT